jgi:molybdopterin-containing oxidoreductase family iron-sulfur binding subunit
MTPVDAGRRDFLGLSAAMAGLALAPGVVLYDYAQAKAPGESASARVRWGMLIDTTRCAEGCMDCVDACGRENGLGSSTGRTDSQWIRKVDLKDARSGKAVSLPVLCQHCADPPCVDVCPTGASFKRADGIVLVDRHTCIGCRYCMMACPYKARSFVHAVVSEQRSEVPRGKGCVESCTLCVHRVDRGATPACVEACAKAGHRAIVFGDLNDPESEISRRVRAVTTTQLRADLRLDTGVRYEGL